MPLEHSSSPKAFSRNVAAERNAGKPRDQALAIAYRIKREGRAAGGPPPAPWQVRSEAKSMMHSGPILSAVPGRTDKHNVSVKPGSYILNADTISHLGQNNTNAGLAMAAHMFGKSGPFGAPAAGMKMGPGAPKPPKLMRADGGSAEGDAAPVDIVVAGGEFAVEPEIVANIGRGDVERGHKVLDHWMQLMRKDHINTLKKLPGPAKS